MTLNDTQLDLNRPATNECPRCTTRFVCEVALGRDRCWCMDLAAVMPVDGEARCLCRDCLTQAINAKEPLAGELDGGGCSGSR